MIKTIISDLGETYVQGMVGVEAEVSRTLRVKQSDVLPVHLSGKKKDLLFRGKIAEDEFWRRVVEENGYPKSVDGYASTADFLKAAMRRNFRQIEGMEEIMRSLKQSGYRLGLLSDHVWEWVEYCEEHFPLDIFDAKCYSFATGERKTSPRIYNMILSEMDADRKSTLYVDDNPECIRIAQSDAVGIGYVHLFVHARHFSEYLKLMNIM